MTVPFVIYADFELSNKLIDTCLPSPNEFYTKKIQKHIPISFVIYVISNDDSIHMSRIFKFTARNKTEDVVQIFMDYLEGIVKDIYKLQKYKQKKYKCTENMIGLITKEDEKSF